MMITARNFKFVLLYRDTKNTKRSECMEIDTFDSYDAAENAAKQGVRDMWAIQGDKAGSFIIAMRFEEWGGVLRELCSVRHGKGCNAIIINGYSND